MTTLEAVDVHSEVKDRSIASQVRRARFAALRKLNEAESEYDRDRRLAGKPDSDYLAWESLIHKFADREDTISLNRIANRLDKSYGDYGEYMLPEAEDFRVAMVGFNRVAPSGSEELFVAYMQFVTESAGYIRDYNCARYIPLLQKYPDRVDEVTYFVTHFGRLDGLPTVKDIERRLKWRTDTTMLPAFYVPSFVMRKSLFSNAKRVTDNVVGHNDSLSEAVPVIRWFGRTVVSMINDAIDENLVSARLDYAKEDRYSTPEETRGSLFQYRGMTRRRIAELILLMRSVQDIIGPDDGTSSFSPYELQRVFFGLQRINPLSSAAKSPLKMETEEEFRQQSTLFRFMLQALHAQNGIANEERVVVLSVDKSGNDSYVTANPEWVDLVLRRNTTEDMNALVAFIAEKRSTSAVDAEAYLDANAQAAIRVGWL